MSKTSGAGKIKAKDTEKVNKQKNQKSFHSYINKLVDKNLANKHDIIEELLRNEAVDKNTDDYLALYAKGEKLLAQSSGEQNKNREAIECFAISLDKAPEEDRDILRHLMVSDFVKSCLDVARISCELFRTAASASSFIQLRHIQPKMVIMFNQFFRLDKFYFEDRICTIDEGRFEIPARTQILDTILDTWYELIYPEYINNTDGYPCDEAFDQFVNKTKVCCHVFFETIEVRNDFTFAEQIDRMVNLLQKMYACCSYEERVGIVGVDLQSGRRIFGKWYEKKRQFSEDENKEWENYVSRCVEISDQIEELVDYRKKKSPDFYVNHNVVVKEQLAQLEMEAKRYESAEEYYLEAVEIFEKIKEEYGKEGYELPRARVYSAIGSLYTILENKEKEAESYLDLAEKILCSPKCVLSNEDEFLLANTLFSFGKLRQKQKLGNEAIQYFKRAYEKCFYGSQVRNKTYVELAAQVSANLGLELIKEGTNTEKGEEYLEKALDICLDERFEDDESIEDLSVEICMRYSESILQSNKKKAKTLKRRAKRIKQRAFLRRIFD